MNYLQPLRQGRFLRRYKRFFVDIATPAGIITAHCPNTGSMKHCYGEDWTAYYSDVGPDTARKLRYTLEQIRNPEGERIGLHTGRANTLAAEAIAAGLLPRIPASAEIRREVAYGEEASRIDLLADDCYIEVKSVTLKENDGIGYFPDAVSTRGQKHLRELSRLAAEGRRAMLLFAVQHTGITQVKAAAHIDPAYALGLAEAASAGVAILALGAEMDDAGIRLVRRLPVVLD